VRTDWLLVRRLAAELERELRGARIRGAGTMPDGRFGLNVRAGTVAIDAFGPTPLVTLEPEVALATQAGWVRTMADTLVGLRIERVRARTGDRLLAFECAAQSRFGVASAFRLVVELVPRFGNIVLLRDDTVVTAAKEFSRAKNARRAVLVGETYEPPPLPEAPIELGAAEGNGPDPADERIYAYWEDDRLVAAHLHPLARFAALRTTREAALLPLLSRAAGTATHDRAAQAFEDRRAALRARIAKRTKALAADRAALERERDDAGSRDDLRRAGELLYAHATDVPQRATSFIPESEPERTIVLDPELDAKGNAAAIFKRYRKAVARGEHAETRLTELERDEQFAEELAWELERAEPELLPELTENVERLERRKAQPVRHAARRAKPIEVPVADDARIYVGRSPRGNADLTFRVARPDDFWFHARAVPGAHVVLHIDTVRAATERELLRAAELAAYHSKARDASNVAVDYTQRKFVRRRQNAPPGLVWYTNARTLTVTPVPA
jgi:predicted ribosome quality control (RQC) complex YloA/Tae2 family protein